MVSLTRPHLIFDPIRKIWVKATPEENIRQAWIHKIVHQLGFPEELIGVEVSLTALPHIVQGAPERRADLICFGKQIHSEYALYPLLLIECKQELRAADFDQLLGYNHFVKAFFVALVSAEKAIFSSRDDTAHFLAFIPSYHQLLEGIRHAPR
jgi:hypothetical protein